MLTFEQKKAKTKECVGLEPAPMPADLSQFKVTQLAPGAGFEFNLDDPRRHSAVVQKAKCRICQRPKPISQIDNGICTSCG